MNCIKIRPILINYLNGESSFSEKKLVQAHLAVCEACRDELAGLAGLQQDLRQSLHQRADRNDSPAQAWKRLEASLAKEARKKRNISTSTWREQVMKGISTAAQIGLISLVILATAAAILFTLPQGQAWTQQLKHFFANADKLATPTPQAIPTLKPAIPVEQFFTHAESDQLPRQVLHLPPDSETPTPDPTDIQSAKLTISEVERLAGYPVLEPAWVPDGFTFAGAIFDPGTRTARLFFQTADRNGRELDLTLLEEPGQIRDVDTLSSLVGLYAKIETTQIGNIRMEYVEGVWHLKDEGPFWESDPWVKRLRWQANGMGFELNYFGPPESMISKDNLIDIAASISARPRGLLDQWGPNRVFSLQAVEAQAGFPLLKPSSLPSGTLFMVARIEDDSVMTFYSPARESMPSFWIGQCPLQEGVGNACQKVLDSIPQEAREAAAIRGVQAIYAAGELWAAAGEDIHWMAEDPGHTQWIYWEENGFSFLVRAMVAPPDEANDQEMLLSFAESLQ